MTFTGFTCCKLCRCGNRIAITLRAAREMGADSICCGKRALRSIGMFGRDAHSGIPLRCKPTLWTMVAVRTRAQLV